MQVLLPQFLFRVVCGISIAVFAMPPKYAHRGYVRLILWGLTVAAALVAILLFFQRSEFENGNELFSMAAALSTVALAGSLLKRREGADSANLMVGALGLLALVFALMATPWSPETGSATMALGTLDLASCGLILGVTMSAVLLCLWHLNTPEMEAIPWRVLVVLLASAVVVRTVLCIIGAIFAVVDAGSPGVLLWVFIGSRWMMAVLGLAMLVALSRERGRPSAVQRASGLLFAGLALVAAGEMGSQLVSVNLLYSF